MDCCIFFCWLLMVSGALAEQTDGDGFVFYPLVGKAYNLHWEEKNHLEAINACLEEGALLATPRNHEETNVILAITHLSIYLSIGLRKIFEMGIMQTLSGEDIGNATYNHEWLDDYYESKVGIGCGVLARNGIAFFQDCDTKNVFVCERGNPKAYASEPPKSYATDAGYVRDDETGIYYKLHKQLSSWPAAVITCKMEGASLAFARTPAELKFMQTILDIAPDNTLHVGLYSFEPNLYYASGHTCPNKDISITKSETEKPGNCVSIYKSSTYFSHICSTKKSFVCQKETITAFSEPCSFYENDYYFYPEVKLYYKLHRKPKEWAVASRVCRNEGASLAMPADTKEADILRNILAGYPRYALGDPKTPPDYMLLGFNDRIVENLRLTEEGTPIYKLYDRLMEADSEQMRNEDCGAMYRSGELGDVPCSKAALFTCQKAHLAPQGEAPPS